jgi:hypothetical protein
MKIIYIQGFKKSDYFVEYVLIFSKMYQSINTLRSDIQQFFDVRQLIEDETQKKYSKNGLFYFIAQNYRQTDPQRNWVVSKIEIWQNQEKLFQYLTSSDDCCLAATWINQAEIDYLFLPEIMGGQSVYDTQQQKFYSYYDDADPFIVYNVMISPQQDKMAVEGCYWACPQVIRVYDIQKMTDLPYPLLYDSTHLQNPYMEGWQDNNTLKINHQNNMLVVNV